MEDYLQRRFTWISIAILVLFVSTLACQAVSAARRTAVASGDLFFSGRAVVDTNGNGRLDTSDQPLANARFTAGKFAATTNSSGIAVIFLPKGWNQSLSAQMDPPVGSNYTLIDPAEVTLQLGVKTSADFLFSQPFPTPAPTLTGEARPGGVERDLTYCVTNEGVELKMDVYYPRSLKQPAPAVVYVHGGGWRGGNKDEGIGRNFIADLVRDGYVGISINYRLAPEYKFPAEIQDVACAIRHLRANAGRYGIDAQHIGVMGSSAGGHLAALLGLADRNPGWDIGQYQIPYADQSSRVQAVVDMFGPTDLTKLALKPNELEAQNVFGASTSNQSVLEIYSPVNYVSKEAPPFLILQGQEDRTVPPAQSQLLYDLLIKAGANAKLVMVQNAGHGFQPTGGRINPSMQELIQLAADFFDQTLK